MTGGAPETGGRVEPLQAFSAPAARSDLRDVFAQGDDGLLVIGTMPSADLRSQITVANLRLDGAARGVVSAGGVAHERVEQVLATPDGLVVLGFLSIEMSDPTPDGRPGNARLHAVGLGGGGVAWEALDASGFQTPRIHHAAPASEGAMDALVSATDTFRGPLRLSLIRVTPPGL